MSEPIVTIADGRIKGCSCEDARGQTYYSFQGIPYAKPPVGKLRFRAPQPVDPWTDILDATTEGNQSIQKHYLTKQIQGSEDCLNLNVYTPQLGSNVLKPVMVFVYGGAFAQGSNGTEIYGPDFLITQDVVLMIMNYRLGVLGFLSLDDPSLGVPGNAAFKDMVLALKWVQKNISHFGGDPNNVTLFGESAGAASCHFLMLSPMSQGLFHKVIAQSGCALNGWAYGKKNAKELADDLGFAWKDERDILTHLENASVEELIRGQSLLDEKDILSNNARYIGLVVENPESKEEAFFNCSPVDILLSGKYNQIPIIMGFNSLEGALFDILVKRDKQSIYWNDCETNVPIFLNLEKGSHVSKVVGHKIVKFYLGGNEASIDTHRKQLYDVTTDNCFLRGIYSSVRNHVSISKVPIYMYRMDIETELNTYKRLTGTSFPGASHADDLGYLFKNIFTPEILPGSIEDVIQQKFLKLWGNFARYGKPTIECDPLLDGVDWKPAEKNKIHYLNIADKLTMECNPEPKRMAFWDSIFRISPVTAKL